MIIQDIVRKPNSIIVVLYIFHIIHAQKQKRSVRPFCFWGEHSKELSNQAEVELDICSRCCIYHVKFTSYCELIECSRLIRFFIVSLMYNNRVYYAVAQWAWKKINILLYDWLPEQVRWGQSCPVGISRRVPEEKFP